MRTVVIGAVVTLAIAVPSVSEAQWRWLDKLSGPGPFAGIQGEFKLFCRYEGTGARSEADLRNVIGFTVSPPCLRPLGGSPDPEKRLWVFGLGTGLAASFANDLPYEGAPTPGERLVMSLPLELYFDHRVGGWSGRLNFVELGGFAGYHLFFGRASVPFVGGTDVIPFTRKGAVGLRVGLRPLFLSRSGDPIGSVKLRLGVLFYPDGFRAEDFGARPGWTEKGTDPVWFGSIVLDLDRWK